MRESSASANSGAASNPFLSRKHRVSGDNAAGPQKRELRDIVLGLSHLGRSPADEAPYPHKIRSCRGARRGWTEDNEDINSLAGINKRACPTTPHIAGHETKNRKNLHPGRAAVGRENRRLARPAASASEPNCHDRP